MAFAVAALADGLSVVWTLAPPVQWMADAATAISLFVLLGWQWVLLPGLVMEAIPGLYVFPFWVLVVGAMAMWGSARSNWPDGLNPDERSRNHWRMDK
jgi:MFS superfamily sulfate permease-like transporter